MEIRLSFPVFISDDYYRSSIQFVFSIVRDFHEDGHTYRDHRKIEKLFVVLFLNFCAGHATVRVYGIRERKKKINEKVA